MSEPRITVHPSAEDNGLATMVAELMRTNVSSSAYKRLCFSLLKATVVIEATDAEVGATLLFNRGACTVYDGAEVKADLRIIADSESILQLSAIPIVAGFPFYLNETGFSVLSKLLIGSVRIEGMLLSPVSLHFLTVILSVN